MFYCCLVPGGWDGLHGCETSCEVCKRVRIKERSLREFLTCLSLGYALVDYGVSWTLPLQLWYHWRWGCSLRLSTCRAFPILNIMCLCEGPGIWYISVSWPLHVWSRQYLPNSRWDHSDSPGMFPPGTLLTAIHKRAFKVAQRLFSISRMWVCVCQGRDCIERIRKLILKHNVATDKELKVSTQALHLFMIRSFTQSSSSAKAPGS